MEIISFKGMLMMDAQAQAHNVFQCNNAILLSRTEIKQIEMEFS